MRGFLDYVPGDTLLHRLDPRTKLLLPLLLCVGCFASGNMFVLLGVLALDLLLGILGGNFRQAIRLLRGLLKISVFLFLIQVLFVRRGVVLLRLPLGILITDCGVYAAAMVVLRLIGATLPLALMLSLTQLSDLSNALVNKWRIPYKYAFAITSAIRFIPVFSTDMQAIIEAQTARGVEFDTKNFIKRIRLIFPLCVPLLISSVKKIDSAAIAAELRGFNLRGRDSCYKVTRMTVRDGAALALGAAVAVAGLLL